jgi:multiple sugar transport system substrate-binding protein
VRVPDRVGRPRGRRTTFTAALLAVALLLTACPEDDDDEVAADEAVLTWAVPMGDREIHQSTVDLWNEQNPDAQVRLLPTAFDADGQREQMAMVAETESEAIDIFALDVIWTGEFAEEGWLVSLEDLRDEVEDVTLPGAFESAVWEDELWALPYSTNAGIMYYRTDLVDEPPATWEELVEASQEHVDDEEVFSLAAQGAEYEGLVVNFLEYYWSAGGELYDDAGEEVLLDEEAARSALEFMRDNQEDEAYGPRFPSTMEEEARIAFHQGNAVFMRNWPYAYAVMQQDIEEEPSPVADQYDIAPLPTFEGGEEVTALGGLNNAVNAASPNQDQAREFVLFAATDEEVQRSLAEQALPPVMEAMYDEFADDPVMSLLQEVLPTARARPPVPEWHTVSVELHRAVFAAYQGTTEIDDAIEAIREVMEQQLERRQADAGDEDGDEDGDDGA